MKPEKKPESLPAAFAAALMEMPSPALDRVNPRFNQRYATIGSYLDACRPHLAKFGLALASDFEPTADGNLVCWTVIRDASGETLRLAPVPVKVDLGAPQATGSQMTYARRYSISAALGIVGIEDDDANASHEPEPKRKQVSMPQAHAAAAPKSQPKPAANVEALDDGWERVTVDRVETKDGQSAKGPWRLYSVHTTGGERFSTFSATHGGRALELVGKAADVLVKETGKGIELLDIRAANPNAKPAAPAQGGDDDIPF